jgi:hypothetical protein
MDYAKKKLKKWEKPGGIFENVTKTFLRSRPVSLLCFQVHEGNGNINSKLEYS